MAKIVLDTVWVGSPEDDEDDPSNWKEISVPAHYIVCPSCHGEGKSSNYLGAFTQSDIDELGYDFLDDYMAGVYDKTCSECKGERVVLEIDYEMCTDEEKKLVDKHYAELRSEAFWARMESRGAI